MVIALMKQSTMVIIARMESNRSVQVVVLYTFTIIQRIENSLNPAARKLGHARSGVVSILTQSAEYLNKRGLECPKNRKSRLSYRPICRKP